MYVSNLKIIIKKIDFSVADASSK